MKTCMKALQGRTLLDKLYCICLIPWGLCRVPRGEIPEQKTDAYISGVWYTIARNQMKYNSTGKQITFENLALQGQTLLYNGLIIELHVYTYDSLSKFWKGRVACII